MRGIWFGLGGLNGLIAVAAGAFGAHALKTRIAAEYLAIFETASRYQMYHALALLGVAAQSEFQSRRVLNAAAWCMIMGILLFSGSLYGLALTQGALRWLGPVTPIGGALLMTSWLMIFVGALRPSRGLDEKTFDHPKS
ncbi:MAG: DUF423 domain-containing protein [Planctomycetes bacterium]|nr:DUF423 domain-containing protein [Planctomycetota bacterium]MBI3834495.1 DUF423 domain-containing protein [Planctomycetota bacterium]